MANIKYYCTSIDRLDSIPVADGNLIFCEDERAIFLDAYGVRTSYQQIICLETEAQRSALPHPVKGFYFIQDSCILWRYDNGWYQLTTTPQDQIIFRPRESFPEEGESNRIYIDGTKMYRFINGNYELMNKPLEWGVFE